MKKCIIIILSLFSLTTTSCEKDSPLPKEEEKETCSPNVVVDNVTYSLSPCSINATVTKGEVDKVVTVLIVPNKIPVNYGFGVYGYGEGFPTYGIMTDVSSGGAGGTVTIKVRINAKELTAGKTYDGYLPIQIYKGSQSGNENYLKLGMKITVK